MIDRILIVGLGSIGSRHLRIARENFPNSKIKILRHQTSTSNPELSDGCLLTLEEVIDFAPVVAVISNPSTFHLGIAQTLAKIGTHMLIEKPISASSEGVLRLIGICKEMNSVLMLGYNLRFSSSLQHFRNLIKSDLVGKLLSVRCEVGQYLPSWRPGSDYRQGVSAKKILGGGVLLELSHEIDYLRWIFGEVDWVRATISRQSNLDIDVEDSAHMIIGFQKSATEPQLIGTLNMDFIRHDKTRSCVAIGENGTLRWDGVAGEIFVFKEGASAWEKITSSENENDTYRTQWREFVKCVNRSSLPTVTGEDGLRVLEVIEAAHRSAETGTQVTINRVQEQG